MLRSFSRLVSGLLAHLVLVCPVWAQASPDPVSSAGADAELEALSASLVQLRAQFAGADAEATVQALQQWAAQHQAGIDTARERLEASAQASEPAESAPAAPVLGENLSAAGRELATLQYELAVSQRAALAAIPATDAKARRDAMRAWRQQNEAELSQVKTLAGQLQAAVTPESATEQAAHRAELEARASRSNAELRADRPELCDAACELIRRQAQLARAELDFEQAYASADPKSRRDARRALLAGQADLRAQIARLSAQVAASQPTATPAPEPSAAELAALPPEARVRYEARRAWEQGWEQVQAAHPGADSKQIRDLRRTYLARTAGLQALMR